MSGQFIDGAGSPSPQIGSDERTVGSPVLVTGAPASNSSEGRAFAATLEKLNSAKDSNERAAILAEALAGEAHTHLS